MPKIMLYEDARGNFLVNDFVSAIQCGGGGKVVRVQIEQIQTKMKLLEKSGTFTGSGFSKHLRGDVWELKTGKNRILFFPWKGDTYVLLHAFRKTTNQTPSQEIEQAEREIKDWVNNHGH
jgi:phage-related protein